MSSRIVERLKVFMDHKGLNANLLSQSLGYSSSEKLSRLFRIPGAKPSADIIEDIANKFESELNIEWWLTGSGLMLKPSDNVPGVYISNQHEKQNRTVPIVDISAAATYNTKYNTDGYGSKFEKVILPMSLFPEVKYFAFQHWGESMQSTLKDGDYIIASFVEPSEWVNLLDDTICIIVTKSRGIDIKRIKNQIFDQKLLRCRSDNKEYPSYSTKTDDIIQIWKAAAKLSFNLSNEGETINNKLANLEDRIEALEKNEFINQKSKI